MKFAVLTGGGDSSGINDFLYFLAQRLEREGHSLIGFRRSWLGLVNNDAVELGRKCLAQHRFTPGTILGTERKNPIKDGGMDKVLASLEDREVDVLIAMGGDDTLGVANHLAGMGFTVVGVAQTIDDDVQGTDRSLGYYTAIYQGVRAVNSIDVYKRQVLRWCRFTNMAWFRDLGFYYTRYPAPGTVDPGDESNFNQVYWHALGTDQEEDVLIFELPERKELSFHVSLTWDQQYLLLHVFEGTDRRNGLYYRPLGGEPDVYKRQIHTHLHPHIPPISLPRRVYCRRASVLPLSGHRPPPP